MRIPSGVTDQYIYFVAVDATDFTTRETGLSSFTVYRSRDGAAAVAMTTPTINETDTTNMPGVYELLADEDMTIGSGNDSEEMVFHITHAGMAPVTRTIELYRPKITAGNTLDVTATGAAGIDWGNVENPTTAVDLSGTDIQLCDTTTTVTNDVGINEWNGTALSTTNPLPNAAAGAAGGLPTDSTGKTSFNDVSAADVNAQCDQALTDYDAVVPADLPSNFADLSISATTGLVDLSATAIDNIWTENLDAHKTSPGSAAAAIGGSHSGTAQAGGTATTIKLDTGAEGTIDDFYKDQLVVCLDGNTAGQARFITAYEASTRVATVAAWAGSTYPDATTKFQLIAFGAQSGVSAPTANDNAVAVWDKLQSAHTTEGTMGAALGGLLLAEDDAQGGGTATITLAAAEPATTNIYKYQIVKIVGTGARAGQARQITAYNGSSKVATVSLDWEVQPQAGDPYQIVALGIDAATIVQIAAGVWDRQRSASQQAGSFGERVNSNVKQISDNTASADSLESILTGGGGTITAGITGNLTGNVSGSVGSVTGAVGSVSGNVDGSVASVTGAVGSVTGAVGSVTANVTVDDSTPIDANMVQISGSAPAADNLEASALGIISGVAQTGTLSTTQATTDLTGFADGELVGRLIVFTAAGGTADGQAAKITAYASASGLVSFSGGIQTAPVNNDSFVIV